MANTLTDNHASLRAALAGDAHRPGYHFLPPANWMNDPNGLIHCRGRYHLFYQHNPRAAVWGDMHWGHAVSDDLVRWSDRHIALKPDRPYDRDGCFSGCAAAVDDGFALLYTGVRDGVQTQCLATTTDGERFTKHADNPVLPTPPEGFSKCDFRDPYVWREEACEEHPWRMALCAATCDKPKRGAVLLYRSADLARWEFVSVLAVEPAGSEKVTHECPNLFALGGRWILITSPQPTDQAWVYACDFDGQTLTRDTGTVLDRGGCMYAPLTFADAAGRRILFGWIREGRDVDAAVAAGWSGCLTLPRVLTWGEDGSLRQAPAVEVERLRGEAVGSAHDLRGAQLEIDATFRRADRPVGLDVLAGADAESGLAVRIDGKTGRVTAGERDLGALGADEATIRLRVFVDHSVVEVYVNHRVVAALRHYAAPDDDRVRLIGSPESFAAWPMADTRPS